MQEPSQQYPIDLTTRAPLSTSDDPSPYDPSPPGLTVAQTIGLIGISLGKIDALTAQLRASGFEVSVSVSIAYLSSGPTDGDE